jgi:hypothetical protein
MSQKIQYAEIQPVRGYETEPMCRNCRHWMRGEPWAMKGSAGGCQKQSNIAARKPQYQYTHPNYKCDQFRALDYYLRDNGKNKGVHLNR